MSPSKLFRVVVTAALLAGCASSHSTVGVSACTMSIDGGVPMLHARVRNDAYKPVGRVDLVADLYRNFRFARVTASATFAPVLDPGATREIAVPLGLTPAVTGASHCASTRVTYGDGTTDAAP